MPVTDGSVNAAIEYQGSIVIAGNFSRIGDVRANDIARWDGSTWSPLGQGIEWGYINSLAVYEGDLVAAGRFSFAGGVLSRSIARWNGTQWSPFGAGFHDPNTNPREVLCVASRQDTLVAALDLSYEHYYSDPAPTPYAGLVDTWTGSDWVDLGGGANGLVRSLAFHDGVLFAGGTFDSIGGGPAAGLAQWNGSAWSGVGGGLGIYGRSVDALVVYSGRLVAGGNFDSAGGVGVGNIAAWNGTSWEAMGTLPTSVAALASRGDTLVAACENAVERWDGQAWTSAAPPMVGRPGGVVFLGEDLFVAGPIEATNRGDQVPTALSVARLTDGAWHPLMNVVSGMRGLTGQGGQGTDVYTMAPYRGHIVAAGEFQFAGTQTMWTRLSGLAEWTGTRWDPFPPPPGINSFYFLLAKGDTLYLSGTLNGRGGNPSSVYRYDGSNWMPVGIQPNFVSAMTLYGGQLITTVQSFPYDSTSVARWTGTEWENIGTAGSSPSPPIIDAMAEYDGTLVVAGRFQSIGGVTAANIAAWDGVAWQQLGPGYPASPYNPDAIVRRLAVSNGQLFASGDQIPGVAQWSGSAWDNVGHLSGSIFFLGDAGGQLFASGSFYPYDQSNYLFRLNGNEWEQPGSGTNDIVLAMAALGNSVYMGGYFSEAGGKPSYAIARWDGLSSTPGTPALRAPRPNPFARSTDFFYDLPRTGSVRLSIHDVTGREIAVIEEGSRSAGAHVVTWYGQDRSGRRVPSGVYFLRASLPDGASQARKIVLLH